MTKPPESRDLYSKEFLAEALKHKEAIDSEYRKIHKSFEKIAFNIYWMDDNCAYTTFGYSSIRDYAKAEHGISSSTCYDYINVVERFAERGKDGSITAKIADEYKDYGSSKLALICGLTDEEIRELDITPDTPARDIKKLLKSSPAKKPEPEKDRKEEPEPEPRQLSGPEPEQPPEEAKPECKTLAVLKPEGFNLENRTGCMLSLVCLMRGSLGSEIVDHISSGCDVEITAVRRET